MSDRPEWTYSVSAETSAFDDDRDASPEPSWRVTAELVLNEAMPSKRAKPGELSRVMLRLHAALEKALRGYLAGNGESSALELATANFPRLVASAKARFLWCDTAVAQQLLAFNTARNDIAHKLFDPPYDTVASFRYYARRALATMLGRRLRPDWMLWLESDRTQYFFRQAGSLGIACFVIAMLLYYTQSAAHNIVKASPAVSGLAVIGIVLRSAAFFGQRRLVWGVIWLVVLASWLACQMSGTLPTLNVAAP